MICGLYVPPCNATAIHGTYIDGKSESFCANKKENMSLLKKKKKIVTTLDLNKCLK
mgnify:CR=1 FL=1